MVCVSRVNSISDYTDTVSLSKDFVTKRVTVCPTNRMMHLLFRKTRKEISLEIITNPDENKVRETELGNSNLSSAMREDR